MKIEYLCYLSATAIVWILLQGGDSQTLNSDEEASLQLRRVEEQRLLLNWEIRPVEVNPLRITLIRPFFPPKQFREFRAS